MSSPEVNVMSVIAFIQLMDEAERKKLTHSLHQTWKRSKHNTQESV
jgi:hypothetical protein